MSIKRNQQANLIFFLKLIDAAGSKETLGKVGLKIKESHLPESAKDVTRGIYCERFNSLAAVEKSLSAAVCPCL